MTLSDFKSAEMVFCLEMATVDENGVTLANGLLGEMKLKETALVAG